MKLSRRINNVEASKTTRFTSLIQQLAKQGKHIINFAVGEPGFEIPEGIIRATQQALADGKTKYSPISGIPELKAGLAAHYEGYDAGNLIVSNGSKQLLYALFQILCDPADEVIIPRPFWVSFAEQVKLAAAKPVYVDTRDHQLDIPAMERAISPKTRAILINTPNNPTGAVYPRTALEAVAELAIEKDLFLVADEAYRCFVYDGVEHHSLFSIPAVRDRCILVGSFSKTFGMTGFRVGYAAAPKPIIQALSRIQSHLTGNVCTFAQFGALAALALTPEVIEKNRRQLERKREIAYRYAARLFSCMKPQGAFYIFPDISARLKPHETAEAFAAALLEKAGVAVVPGEAFGVANHIRISYALPEDELVEGFERMMTLL